MMADRGRCVIEDLDDDDGGLSFDESVDMLASENELKQLLDEHLDNQG